MIRRSGNRPGSSRDTGVSRLSRRSATSCSATVATIVLVTLPTRNRSPGFASRPVRRSASPLAPDQVLPSTRTCATAAGTPVATI